MQGFRDREKNRQVALKPSLFSAAAQADGRYGQHAYPFCLGGTLPGENLYDGIRDAAIRYFRERKIGWHRGERESVPSDLPNRHLCCSQSMCVNTLFPLMEDPRTLSVLLVNLGYPCIEPLRFNPDSDAFIEPGYVAFEWIGLHNYLRELSRGRVAPDLQRTRGAGFTSADFAFRFKRADHRVQIVLGEWKYTEHYHARSIRFSRPGTDRLRIYHSALTAIDCPIDYRQAGADALFYDPFDQMMRLQLLAHAIEHTQELEADIVSVLHVVPSANRELLDRITSPKLKPLGRSVHDVWRAMVNEDKFKAVHAEDVLANLLGTIPNRQWTAYMQARYGAMI
jgi:hypothetical protein